MIPRLSLFEVEDLRWCPGWVRDGMTSWLRFITSRTFVYEGVADRMAEMVRTTGTTRVVDLGSGGGGPWPDLRERLLTRGADPEVLCTDLHPNRLAAEWLERHQGMSYHLHPVSALEVPDELHGMRTMFALLHHFPPDDARSILASAQRHGLPFLAIEATERSWRGILVTFLTPVMVFLTMPFVRPVRPWVLLLTYFPPLFPVLIWWDGLVSMLRTYRPEELRDMAEALPASGYRWEVGKIEVPRAPIPITYVAGRPEARAL